MAYQPCMTVCASLEALGGKSCHNSCKLGVLLSPTLHTILCYVEPSFLRLLLASTFLFLVKQSSYQGSQVPMVAAFSFSSATAPVQFPTS